MALTSITSESICSVCCETFSKVETNSSHLSHIQKLCSATANINNTRGSGVKVNFSEIEMLIGLACPRCLVCVSSALTKREQVNSLEEEVRQLQMKILQLQNNIEENVQELQTEVNMMEGIVQLGRDNIRNLDEFYVTEAVESGIKRLGLKNVLRFREKVLTVAEDLRNFSNNFPTLSTSDTRTGQSSAEVELINNITVVEPVCEQMEDEASCVEADHVDDNYAEDFMEASRSADQGNVKNKYLPSTSSPKLSRKNMKRNSSKTGSPHTLLQTTDFSNMRTFKKKLITRIIKRKEKLQTRQNIKSNRKSQHKTPEELRIDELDPKNFCFVSYNPRKPNMFSLRNIKIRIDEQQESLQCGKCGFKRYQSKCRAGRAFELEDAMYNHVVGHHLKLYKCPHCHRDSFLELKALRDHVLSHSARRPYLCAMRCGATYKNKRSCKRHEKRCGKV